MNLLDQIENEILSPAIELQLEKSYTDSLVWESNIDDLSKARQVAPVGTIKRIGQVEYIKTPEGWRYHTKGQRKKAQDHYGKQGGAMPAHLQGAMPAHLQGDISDYRKNNGGHTSFKIKEGDSITAKDGTQGEVVSHDGQQVTVKFSTKDGEEKTVKVDAQKLEHNLAAGNLKHQPTKENAEQGKEPEHEDNDNNVAAQAESESKPESKKESDDSIEDVTGKEGKIPKEKDDEKKAREATNKEKEKKDSEKTNKLTDKLKNQGIDIEKHKDILNATFLSDQEKESLINTRLKLKHDPEKNTETKQEEKPIAEVAKETNLNIESVQDAKVLGEGKDGPAKLNEEKEGFSVKQDEPLTRGSDSNSDTKTKEANEINQKFDAFARFARGVIKGRMKSMIAYGSGGVGKTYTVTQELQKAGKKIYDPEIHKPGDEDYDYVKITGKMTPAAVYENMYKHNGKILLFDDCDSVLQNPDAINLFKGALDTSGDGSIDWGSKAKIKDNDGNILPEKFAFKGRAMFVSNLDVQGKAKESLQPIISRGYGIDLTMTPQQTIDRISHIAQAKDGSMTNLKFPGIEDYTHDDMNEVLSYMRKNADKAADLNVRTVGALLGIKLEAEADGIKDWTKEANYHYLKKSESQADPYNDLSKNHYSQRIKETYGIVEKSKYSTELVENFKKSMKDRIESRETYIND